MIFNLLQPWFIIQQIFTLSNFQLSEAVVSGGEFRLAVSLAVENIGRVYWLQGHPGVHFSTCNFRVDSPAVATQRIYKVTRDLVPGGKEYVEVVLDKYAVSYWSNMIDAWTVETGVYRLEVGTG